MAIKHKSIDPESGAEALKVMFIQIRRADKAIAELEDMQVLQPQILG